MGVLSALLPPPPPLPLPPPPPLLLQHNLPSPLLQSTGVLTQQWPPAAPWRALGRLVCAVADL